MESVVHGLCNEYFGAEPEELEYVIVNEHEVHLCASTIANQMVSMLMNWLG